MTCSFSPVSTRAARSRWLPVDLALDRSRRRERRRGARTRTRGGTRGRRSLDGARRRAATSPSRRQPAAKRHPPHPAGTRITVQGRAPRRRRLLVGRSTRAQASRRSTCCASLRALLPRRSVTDERERRCRARPGHRRIDRRLSRRKGHRHERHRPRRDLHRHAALRSGGLGFAAAPGDHSVFSSSSADAPAV
jgi:hypothetical protein